MWTAKEIKVMKKVPLLDEYSAKQSDERMPLFKEE